MSNFNKWCSTVNNGKVTYVEISGTRRVQFRRSKGQNYVRLVDTSKPNGKLVQRRFNTLAEAYEFMYE